MITIRIHHELIEKTNRAEGEWSIPHFDGMTVADIIKSQNIPELEVGIIIVNNMAGQRNTNLAKGDIIDIFPPFAGG